MENSNELDLREAIAHINPGSLNYQEWLNVGMGLKEAGYPVSVWDDWSRQDSPRYKSGECSRKWNGFRGADNPVTGGTVVQMALNRGWQPERTGGRELGWDDVIGTKEDTVVVDKNWLEGQSVRDPGDKWDPVQHLVTYLSALFDSTDIVGYVTRSWVKDGRHMPSSGCFDRTAGKLIEELSKCGGDIGKVLGDYDPEAGAWIRFNPLDGKGITNQNVTDYRFALVESDTLPIEEQNAIIHTMELPVAALVHSGGKSLHAIVRVDAGSYEEYRKRVDYLYEVCRKNGLDIDRQNRNPSRLSRMPGVLRNGKRQFLAESNIGKDSWDEWKEWIESVNDDLPDIENDLSEDLPELAPPLIDSVLRQGHKMLLAGPSKAGKSFALIELSICIAEGLPWMGFQCTQGKVMYVNLELDRASCLHRFHDIRQAMGAPSRNGVSIWNLRGRSVPMDKLAPKLIRRASKQNYAAIIIDPIYKVITGDENSADQMANFCNQFDKVCTELGCAVIYCHHHSKGSQGGKRSMDRASGSGVFARDPDALLDLIELPISEDLRKQETNNAVGRACSKVLQATGKLNEVSQDDLCSEKAALEACRDVLDANEYADLTEAVTAAKKAEEAVTAWRIDGTLREFPKFSPVNLWFDYPVHRSDASGVLADVNPDADIPGWQRGKEKRKSNAEKERISQEQKFVDAVNSCNYGNPPTVKNLCEYFAKDGEPAKENTIRKWIKKYGYSIDKNTGIVVRHEGDET